MRMKSLFAYVFPVIVLAALSVSCGGGRSKTSAAAGQVIEVTDAMLQRGGVDTVRFGTLHEGEMAVRSVTLHNAASEPAIIVDSERSCGCVSVDYERRPVMPGEMSPVEFRFDSRGEYGWQMKLITLRLGARGVPLKIYVEAEVEW